MARDAARRAFAPDGKVTQPELLTKAGAWLSEARLFVNEMDRASFMMPYGPAYPLATKGRFYLYGWPAPAPAADHPSDAMAPLVWRMFAGMGYEPLSDTDLHPQAGWSIQQTVHLASRDPGTAILYGASEEMGVQAWKLYERRNLDAAWRQAKATISLWEADAEALQKIKERKVGTYYNFDGTVEGFQRIHDYWALNDVAACYFILAKICDEQQNYAEARDYLAKILERFYLAQMWDKRGWFWDPVDTIRMDFADVHPDHYADLVTKIPDIPALPADMVDKPSNLGPYFARAHTTSAD